MRGNMGDYGQFKIDGNDYYMKETAFPEGYPRCFCLYNYSVQKNPVAYALIYQQAVEVDNATRLDHTAQLWHVWTKDDQRRKGLASSIIEFLKRKYVQIITQIATKEGKELCLKNGFTLQESSTKDGTDWLVWDKTKEKKDAAEKRDE